MERYDNAGDSLDHRFKPKPRTETSTLHQQTLKEPVAFERDDEAAKNLREWNSDEER